MLAAIRSYLTEMNVSPQLADEMLKTAPSDVRYLSAKEQERLGLTIIDPIELETNTLQQAKELGISRREHTRREALVRSSCPTDADYSNCYEQIMKSGKLPLVGLSRFGTPVE